MTIFGIPTWTFPSSTVFPYGALSVAKSANYQAILFDHTFQLWNSWTSRLTKNGFLLPSSPLLTLSVDFMARTKLRDASCDMRCNGGRSCNNFTGSLIRTPPKSTICSSSTSTWRVKDGEASDSPLF